MSRKRIRLERLILREDPVSDRREMMVIRDDNKENSDDEEMSNITEMLKYV